MLRGLLSQPKSLPCKYFYDRRGSVLFDQICELPEYYPTRTELAITERYACEMSAALGSGVALVEYGSGSSTKSRLLLDALDEPAGYVPVDISADHLFAASEAIEDDYPDVQIAPVAADFTRPFELPDLDRPENRVAIYFPGSTIGNFEQAEAIDLLKAARATCGDGGALLIGFDLAKDPQVIHDAYNDSQGVTADFNENLLVRINRELDADIELAAFEHEARYVSRRGRVEIGLRCLGAHTATIAGEQVRFRHGELVLTEYSHKYTIAGLSEMLEEAGFETRRVWTDARRWFGVAYATAAK